MNLNHDIKNNTFQRHNEKKLKRPHFSIPFITIIPSTSILVLKIIGWLVIYIKGLGLKTYVD